MTTPGAADPLTPGRPAANAATARPPLHLSVTRPVDPRRSRQSPRGDRFNRHGTRVVERPLLCATARGSWFANAGALPLRDASCQSIACEHTLEYVRDELALLAEFARLLVPGGCLTLAVPNAGPTAGLDALNLYHYLVDTTRRGAKPPESDEVGWRRHYPAAGLTALLEPHFRMDRISTRRLGAAELLDVALLVGDRWFLRNEDRYQRHRRLANRLGALEDRLPTGRFGGTLLIQATRLGDPGEP